MYLHLLIITGHHDFLKIFFTYQELSLYLLTFRNPKIGRYSQEYETLFFLRFSLSLYGGFLLYITCTSLYCSYLGHSLTPQTAILRISLSSLFVFLINPILLPPNRLFTPRWFCYTGHFPRNFLIDHKLSRCPHIIIAIATSFFCLLQITHFLIFTCHAHFILLVTETHLLFCL